jgi:hypothetical protein
VLVRKLHRDLSGVGVDLVVNFDGDGDVDGDDLL